MEKPPLLRNRDHPSFSSSLLDAIYRSIDESNDATSSHIGARETPDRFSLPTLPPKKPFNRYADKVTATVAESPLLRRKHERRPAPSWTTSSSDGFSSSDGEPAIYSVRQRRSQLRSDHAGSDRPPRALEKKNDSIQSRLPDPRKPKSPASPGARFASFLNSLFSGSGNSKKLRITIPAPDPEDSTPPSSASSYSRSCLSKTPSSMGTREKRSVRFYPVGVVVGEDCKPCGKMRIDGVDWAASVGETAKTFEEEDDDDVASDASSDLFELENLTAIGDVYRDELPVYETTNLGTNRAIAYGLL